MLFCYRRSSYERREKDWTWNVQVVLLLKGLILLKCLSPLKDFFLPIFKHAYILAIPNTNIECKYIKTNVSIVEKIIRHCMQNVLMCLLGNTITRTKNLGIKKRQQNFNKNHCWIIHFWNISRAYLIYFTWIFCLLPW